MCRATGRAQFAPNSVRSDARLVPLDQAEALVATDLRPRNARHARHVLAHLGLVAGPGAERHGVETARRRISAVRGAGDRRQARGLCALSGQSRLRARLCRPAISSWSRRWGIQRKPTTQSGAFSSDIDWLARVKAIYLPLDHPLLLSLADPRRLNFLVREGLWVRLIDVGAALSARGYATDDAHRGRCDGRILPVECRTLARQRAARSRKPPPSRISPAMSLRSAASISAASLSRSYARSLRMTELRAGAIVRADAMFRSDRAPWCPELF